MGSTVKVILDADGKLPELEGKTTTGEVYAITALPGGMQSGLPSVGIVTKMADGSYVFSEISLRTFLAAASALRGRYGDVLAGGDTQNKPPSDPASLN